MACLRRVALGAAMVLIPLASSMAQSGKVKSGLAGIVVDGDDTPVVYAEVAVIQGKAVTRSDDAGHFRLSGLNAGSSLISVRRLGFEPVFFDIVIPNASIVELRVRMVRSATELIPVEVEAIRDPLTQVGFYDRMASGTGHFISPANLAKLNPRRATDALRNIPNLVIDRRGSRTRVMGGNGRCEYALVVDRIRAGDPGSRVSTTSPDDLVSASDLYAIEIYPRNQGLPGQYLGMSHEDGCGTILIWTKGMIAR
ncbi:MAG: carboxypeptidase-like regulatory domain-containing protein [Gemmatimonadaceae bacterium]